ncbi:MAG: hypothetical protein GY854_04420 [Deltaproteobacteria bacterium]|nr:hypothetical protein [Deltaproteobacteria bacterium]
MKFDNNETRQIYESYLRIMQALFDDAGRAAKLWSKEEENLFYRSNALIERDCVGIVKGPVFVPRRNPVP